MSCCHVLLAAADDGRRTLLEASLCAAGHQVTAVRESIGSIKMIADNVVDLERRVQERIEGPILETVGFVSAVFRGVRTFLDRVRV